MDCSVCRQLAAYRRPGGPAELAPEDVAALDRHLAGCPACAAALARQDGFDAALTRVMQAVPVPAGLRDRLLADAMARRGAEWRGRVYRGAAALAAAVVFLGICSSIYSMARPDFPTDALADSFAAETESQEGAVRNWLADQGLPPGFPGNLDFDFRNCRSHGFAEVKGRKVPVVRFEISQPGAIRPDTARVYVVRAGQFDLKTLKNAQNSYCSVQVFRDDADGLAYVVLYTTPTLDPFLKPVGLRTVLLRANAFPPPAPTSVQ